MANQEENGDVEEEKEFFLPLQTVEDVQQKLEKFLQRNPSSQIATHEIPNTGRIHRVEKPWGDSTLAIVLPDDLDEIADALNNLFLSERLSALWHEDTKDIEVIWTALPLSEDQKEVAGRKFTFQYNGKKYKCEFGDSSDRLKLISAYTVPTTNPSATQFRNIQSFHRMAHQKHYDEAKEYCARSFWIRNVRLSEKLAIRLIECLNFYMTYYDARSPRVLVHDVHTDVNRKTRYIQGSFPQHIAARALDENVTSFWDAARQPNAMLRFIFYYRIVEYASSHYLDAAVRAKLVRVLANPTISQNIDESLERILSAFDGSGASEVPRFNNLIAAAVRPETVWREIENNKALFCEDVTFDGGYKLGAITSREESLKGFSSGGLVKFSNAIRNIRNVLVHGRDQNTATAITPTPRNMKYLSAWVNVIAAAAGEVVVYGHNA